MSSNWNTFQITKIESRKEIRNKYGNKKTKKKKKQTFYLGLSDSVYSCHGLHIHLRIPVTIIENHRVRGKQVDTLPARSVKE